MALLSPIISLFLAHYYRYYGSNGDIITPNNILAILSLRITTVMYLDVTSYYYHCCPFEMSITTITTYICGSNGTITTLFPLHYVLSVLLLPITTVIMRPLLPINQVSNE
jgi:hypothetical protein